jgi:hypothetical protein
MAGIGIKYGRIVFALAGITLWAAMAVADDALEIGKPYVVRDNAKGALSYQFTKVPLEKGESITIVEQIGDEYVVQRESGEKVKIRVFVLQEALKEKLIALPKEPRPPFRSTITYSPNEPEGYKDFKFGMTYEETREFYHPLGDRGRKQNIPLSRNAILAEEKRLNLPFEDSIGPVHVKVYLGFLPDRPVKPESTLSSVSLSFEPKDYETLKEIFNKRYGKPTSSQQEPYKTQGGAESTNETLIWKGPHSFIYLSRYGNRITEGSAQMGTNEGLEAFLKRRDEEIRAAAKGL